QNFRLQPDHGRGLPVCQSLRQQDAGPCLFAPTRGIYRHDPRRHAGVYRPDVAFQMPRHCGSVRHRHAAPRRGGRIGRFLMEISATIASFLTYVRVEKGLSANTVSAYRRDLMKFDSYAKKKKLTLEGVTRDDLVDFLSSLFRQKLESRTVARHLVTLRNFFRFAQTQDLISVDPALNLESPKIRRSLPGYLRMEEIERLLVQPDDKTPIGLRDRAMLDVLYSTGLRVSELIGLRVMDLDRSVGCVRSIGKGDKERIVPIGKKALALVDRYLRDARPKLVPAGKQVNS